MDEIDREDLRKRHTIGVGESRDKAERIPTS